jgi:alkylation response protein AidB-like acyl-CoA dehydrogenase
VTRPSTASGSGGGSGAESGGESGAGQQFALNAGQRAFVAEIRDVATTVLAPLAAAGEPGRVNRPLLAAMGEHGLLARLFPGVGAASADVPTHHRQAAALDLCLLRETIAAISPEAETALALQGLGGYPVLQSGTDAQISALLPGIATGRTVAAYALTEPGAGSDAAALQLAAEPDGDGWRLTGTKMWISNAPDADVYTVFARTTVGAGARGVTAFVVPADRSGLSGHHLEMLSAHPIGTVEFDGVSVAPCDVLGEVDRGFRVAMRTLDLFRPSVGAFTIGMAQAALDAAARHAVTREAFGGTLADRQAVAHLLAETRTRIEAARLLVYAAAAAYDHGEHSPAMSAMAKLLATETAQAAIDAAIQIHGARALRRGHLLEHLYRDVRATRIYEGASEVQRDIIARDIIAGARKWLSQAESDVEWTGAPGRPEGEAR